MFCVLCILFLLYYVDSFAWIKHEKMEVSYFFGPLCTVCVKHVHVHPEYCCLNSFGRRCFAVAGPSTWNPLPDSFCNPALSLNMFRRQLKTYFIAKYWRDVLSALESFFLSIMRYINLHLTYLLTYSFDQLYFCWFDSCWKWNRPTVCISIVFA